MAQVKPEAPSAGFIGSSLSEVKLIEGFTTSKIFAQIIDPDQIKEGHVYYITFEDTVKKGAEDTLTTKNFTLVDSTTSTTLINKSTKWGANVEGELIDGFRLKLINESRVSLNNELSRWSRPAVTKFVVQKFVQNPGLVQGQQIPNDYLIIFGDVGLSASKDFRRNNVLFPSIPVNFKVFNKSTNKFIDFGFIETDNSGPHPTGWFSSNGGARQDRIIFLEPKGEDTTLVPTWWFYLDRADTSIAPHIIPEPGDTAVISLIKPFLSSDVFQFTSKSAYIDNAKAIGELENIKVVPNPYLANALWEPKNPYSSGRGPRSIHFTHLPSKCTIRIFTVSGELVKEIDHDSNLADGSEEWNLLTKDNLSASYGVYIYHVDAPGIGSKAGKFAIIK